MMFAIKIKLSRESAHRSLSPVCLSTASQQGDSIQTMSFSWCLTGLLLISLTGAHGLNRFPENYVIAKRNDNSLVTLTCRTAGEGPLVWKLNDEDVDFEYHYERDGKNLVVSEIDAPLLGEYSCWRGGEKLSSTFLLQEAEEQTDKENKKTDSFLSCRAKSYDCNFTCSWNNNHYTAVRLGVGQECATHQESCKWVSSSDLQSQGSQFLLSHTLSPYAEESTKLEVTAEATNNNFYFLSENKKFYLRDIVVPDIPHIARCQEVDQELNVTIDPPSSWSTPHSFFSLEHEIEYVFRDDGSRQRTQSTLIPKGISKLRVRSRDSVVVSPWSQWTPWKNVRRGKKKQRRCRNKEKFCCTKVSPGSLDFCKKRAGTGQKLKMLRENKIMEN